VAPIIDFPDRGAVVPSSTRVADPRPARAVARRSAGRVRSGSAPDGSGAAVAADDGPAARAATAGITAVWNGPCSGAVELARLAGPDDAELTGVDAARLRLAGSPPWR